MNIDFSDFLPLLEKYGLAVIGLWFIINYIKSLGDKVDELAQTSHKVYGLLIAMSDKNKRPDGEV